MLALNGAHDAQVDLDRALVAADAQALTARLRLVYGLLRLDRPDEALAAAQSLDALAAPGPAGLAAIARRYAQVRAERPWARLSTEERVYLQRLLWRELPASPEQTWSLEYRMQTESLALRRAR